MGDLFFDFSSGDLGFSISDKMGMNADGDLMMRMGGNMAMDMETGEMHVVSSFGNGDDNND